MSRNLTKLLGDSVQTRVAVSELRRMAGDDSDVRLITEILARAHSKGLRLLSRSAAQWWPAKRARGS